MNKECQKCKSKNVIIEKAVDCETNEYKIIIDCKDCGFVQVFKENENMENRCVCCGTIIPEGRQICDNCLNHGKDVSKNNEEKDVSKDNEKKSISKILLVEDGSVDVEELRKILPDDIYVLVYRQGSIKPQLMNLNNSIDLPIL